MGWDGATFDVLDRMIQKGLMPNLAQLIARGTRAGLLSTIPPITGPAWASFRTGKVPGNHGVFSFLKPPGDSLHQNRIERLDATHIDGLSLWNIFNHFGLPVMVADMPMTDPVEKVKGAMISGMMTRGKRGALCYPGDLKEELENCFPTYFTRSLTDGISTSPSYLDRLIESLREKSVMDFYLLEHHPWNLFVTVYSAVDTLQHYFWKFIKEDPGGKYGAKIESFFRRLDETLAGYLEFLGPGDNLVILSDHGFGPCDYIFFVNNFLLSRGFLTLEGGKGTALFNKDRLKKILLKLDFFDFKRWLGKEARESLGRKLTPNTRIDWLASSAYFRASNELGIYINRQESYHGGCVSPDRYFPLRREIMACLREIKNPITGLGIFKKVSPREEVYPGGKYLEKAPDIMLEPAPGIKVSSFDLSNLDQFVQPNSGLLTGFHENRGVFVGVGCDFRKGEEVGDFPIWDVTPTLLHLSRMAISSDMDGEVNKTVLKEEHVLREIGKWDYPLEKDFVLDDPDIDSHEIEQLKGLGYLD